MMKIGLIVNPIAGIGGRVGLKGSDGEFLKKALKLGGRSFAPQRTVEALQEIANAKIEFAMLAYPSEMGEEEAVECGMTPIVLGNILSGQTTAEETKRAVEDLVKNGIELLLFSGGDGTARDVMEILDEKIPVIGIPAGVKMHSGVFAINPRLAGKLAISFMKEATISRRVEVVDYDGNGNLKLFGYMLVPFDSRILQGTKSYISALEGDEEAIAAGIIEEFVKDCAYIIGPGMTAKSILQSLGLSYTMLGIDVIRNKQLLIKDANEQQLLDIVNRYDAKVIVGVIGGQGFLLGRGNQQISPDVLRKVGKQNLIVLATEEKLLSLKNRPLLIDTGDQELDPHFAGYVRVVTGCRRATLWPVGEPT